MALSATRRSVNLRKGDILGGRYRVEGVLGAGSMGLVLSARQLDLDRRVAVKVLLPEGVEAERIERLRREARVLARLTTSHVSRLLDIGELDTGVPFIVMELLRGQDLGTLLREHGPLPIDETVRLMLEACEGLAEAHDAGIIHRDIKPSNMFLAVTVGGRTELKVLDFGVSKITSIGQSGSFAEKALTSATQLLGSPAYMSPEQLRATRDVDARTDVWSLGIVLHELLCGQRPFDGVSVTDVCVRILDADPPSLTRLRPDVPEGLAAVVLHCLEKDRSDRYASVAELAGALAPFIEAPSHEVAPAPDAPRTASDLVTTASAWWERHLAKRARRRRQGAIAISSIAAIGALSLWWPKEDGLGSARTTGFPLVTSTSAPLPTASRLPGIEDRATSDSFQSQIPHKADRIAASPAKVVRVPAPSPMPSASTTENPLAASASARTMARSDPGY